MSKRRAYQIVFIGLTAGFLFLLYEFTLNSFDVGSGLSYLNGLERAGIPLDAQPTSDAHEEIGRAADIAGIQYAAGSALSSACNFVALLLIVSYAFSLPQLSFKRTLAAGIFVTGLAALSASSVQPIIGSSAERAFKAGVGLWLIGAVLFLVLVTIIWGIKRLFRPRPLPENAE